MPINKEEARRLQEKRLQEIREELINRIDAELADPKNGEALSDPYWLYIKVTDVEFLFAPEIKEIYEALGWSVQLHGHYDGNAIKFRYN